MKDLAKALLIFVARVFFVLALLFMTWFVFEYITNDRGYIKWRGKVIWSYGYPQVDTTAGVEAALQRACAGADSAWAADIRSGKFKNDSPNVAIGWAAALLDSVKQQKSKR